jgi:probable F420-dependent oxidoreductase
VYRSALAATELLAAAACYTRTCRIGTSVLVGGYHRPVELAQRLATIDLLSGGRLVAGLGVGWSDDEHRQMDVDPSRRGRRLTELVEGLRACWSPDPVEFSGEFFSVPPSYVSPKPVQEHIPLLSGAWSRAGLNRTAASFDGWNPAGASAVAVQRVVQQLNELRPPEKAPLTVWFRVFPQPPNGQPDVEGMFEQIRSAREAGFEEVIIDAHFWQEIERPTDWLTLIDRMRPALAEG